MVKLQSKPMIEDVLAQILNDMEKTKLKGAYPEWFDDAIEAGREAMQPKSPIAYRGGAFEYLVLLHGALIVEETKLDKSLSDLWSIKPGADPHWLARQQKACEYLDQARGLVAEFVAEAAKEDLGLLEQLKENPLLKYLVRS